MSTELRFILTVLVGFVLGYGLGFMTGNLNGENKGLRAQDSKAIVTLGATVTTLNRELKIANRVMSAVAKLDTTGNSEEYMRHAIKQLRDSK